MELEHLLNCVYNVPERLRRVNYLAHQPRWHLNNSIPVEQRIWKDQYPLYAEQMEIPSLMILSMAIVLQSVTHITDIEALDLPLSVKAACYKTGRHLCAYYPNSNLIWNFRIPMEYLRIRQFMQIDRVYDREFVRNVRSDPHLWKYNYYPYVQLHIIYWKYIYINTQFEEHMVNWCKSCFNRIRKLHNMPYSRRLKKHVCSIHANSQYIISLYQNSSAWCKICMQSVIIEILTPAECKEKYGTLIHRCNCSTFQDCFRCLPYLRNIPENDSRTMYSDITDTDYIDTEEDADRNDVDTPDIFHIEAEFPVRY